MTNQELALAYNNLQEHVADFVTFRSEIENLEPKGFQKLIQIFLCLALEISLLPHIQNLLH